MLSQNLKKAQPSGEDEAHILLLDDDPDILASLSDLLEMVDGYRIFQAENAEIAENIVAEYEPDIALVDINLGKSNGLDFIESLKRTHPLTTCVVMTAYRDVNYTPQAVRSGADDYMFKPLSPSDMLHNLENLLLRNRLERDKQIFKTQFQAVFNQTFQFLFLLKPSGELIDANQRAVNLINVTQADVIGKQFWRTPWYDFEDKIFSVKKQSDLQSAIAKASFREFIRFETELRNTGDENTPVDFSIKPVRDRNDEVYLLIAEARDIGQRKRMELAIRKSERELRLLLESTTEGIYGIDIEGNCTFANSACIEMLGYKIRAQLLGMNMHVLAHHSRADGTVTAQEDSPVHIAMRDKSSINVDNEVMWRADGSSFPAEYCSSVMYRDDEVVGCVINFLDISERKSVEQKLKLADKAVENAMEAIVMMDGETHIIDVNPAFCNIFGYAREEVIGKKVSDFREGYNKERQGEMWDAIYEQGQWRGELKDKRRDGEELRILLSVTEVKDATGATVHYVALASDASRFKQEEELH